MTAGGVTLLGVLGWMVHALVIGLLLAGAAWLLDRALVRARLPGRWIWLGALWLSIVLPAAGFIAGGADPTMADRAPGDVALSVGFGDVDAAPRFDIGAIVGAPVFIASAWVSAASGWANAAVERTAGHMAAPAWPILYLWVTASALLALVLVVSCVTVGWRRERWPQVAVRGRSVRVAPNMGPAVSGVLRPEIIVPRWCLSLEERELELVLSHEEAHLEAWDCLLMAAALVPVCLVPWNPAVWWQLRRLRDAIEVDCDRRVLRRTGTAASYGRVLLRLGHRTHADIAPALSLSGSPSLLERRLNAMKKRSLRTALPVGVFGSAAGILLVAVACEVDLPVQPSASGETTADRAIAPDAGAAADADSASVDPLYVVDGVIVSDLRALDPNRIESIQVLKDEAAARSHYGEEGRNGVVIIQMKETADDQSTTRSDAVTRLEDGVRGVAIKGMSHTGGRVEIRRSDGEASQ